MYILQAIGKYAEGIAADARLLQTMHYNMSYRYRYGYLSDETIRRIREKLTNKSLIHKWLLENPQEKHRFQVAIHKLQKQGLIKKEKIGERMRLVITALGRKKQEHLERYGGMPAVGKYKGEKSAETMLVIFDVPEKERYKRVWLRMALIALGFHKVQKSVWMGAVRLPKDFIYDIEKLDLAEHIHIFSVNKTGTLIK